jgi:hypothetical protein
MSPGELKTLKWEETPSVPPKMSLSAQNMKTGSNAQGTAESKFSRAKHEKGT